MFRGLKSLHGEKGAIMYVVIALSFGLLLFVPVFIDYASLHYTRRAAQKAADAAALAAAIEYADRLSINTAIIDPDDLEEFAKGFWGEKEVDGKKEKYIDPAISDAARKKFDKEVTDLALSILISVLCCNIPLQKECVAGLYETLWVLTWGNWDDLGRGIASYYANRNGSQMIDYKASCPSLHSLPKLKFIGLVPISPPGIYVEVQRRVPMIYEALYGGEFYVTAKATAEPYLYDYETGLSPCVGPIPPYKGAVITFKFKWKVRLVE
jgi:hypothetical protein